jgi:hypothetical protein
MAAPRGRSLRGSYVGSVTGVREGPLLGQIGGGLVEQLLPRLRTEEAIRVFPDRLGLERNAAALEAPTVST